MTPKRTAKTFVVRREKCHLNPCPSVQRHQYRIGSRQMHASGFEGFFRFSLKPGESARVRLVRVRGRKG